MKMKDRPLVSHHMYIQLLTLIWVGFLGVRFEVGEGKQGTHTYVVSENIPFGTKVLLILLMSAFCKNSASFGKYSTFTQSNRVRTVLEIF